MTYCVGLMLKDGIVLLSDTRTNAGLDNISTYRKMFLYEERGERVIAIMTAGSLSVTQTTIARLEATEENLTTMDEHSDLRLNVTVADLSNEQRRGLGPDDQGVLVTGIEAGPAENAGLYAEDIILQINHVPVKSASQFVELARELPAGKAVPILVRRDNESLYLAVRLPEVKE